MDCETHDSTDMDMGMLQVDDFDSCGGTGLSISAWIHRDRHDLLIAYHSCPLQYMNEVMHSIFVDLLWIAATLEFTCEHYLWPETALQMQCRKTSKRSVENSEAQPFRCNKWMKCCIRNRTRWCALDCDDIDWSEVCRSISWSPDWLDGWMGSHIYKYYM